MLKLQLATPVAVSLVLSSDGVCMPQIPPGWTQSSSASPGPRAAHAVTHDPARARTILFGGESSPFSPGLRGDTWEWDGTNWIPMLFASGPSARAHHAMAFHAGSGRTVMFGGLGTSGGLSDTWLWNGIHWNQASPPLSPPGRRNAAMAGAQALGGVFLFGGETFAPNAGSLDDFWRFDGSNWTHLTQYSGPTARRLHTLAYDSRRASLVMFGGYEGMGGPTDELWEFDGIQWQVRHPAVSPGSRYSHAMAFDEEFGVSVLYGGYEGTTHQPARDTWVWNGASWNRNLDSAPGVRIQPGMAYDANRRRVVLMGGIGQPLFSMLIPWADTYLWNSGYTSTVQNYGSGCGLSLGVSHGSGPIIGTTTNIVATTASSNQGSPWFIAFGWSRQALGAFTLPLPLDGYGLPGCQLLQSFDALDGMLPTGATSSIYQFAIPNWSGLAGLTIYCQSWTLMPAVNSSGAVVSNGVELGFGHS